MNMKSNSSESGEDSKSYENLVTREKLEQKALATLTSGILKKLDISIDNLPQKCQNLLQNVAENQKALEIEKLDSAAINLHCTREISEKLADDYEVLKLKQKNAELQAKIKRNNKFIEELKEDLKSSRKSLASQNPNPDSIQECIRQLKQKVTSYEERYQLDKNKYADLAVPEAILPKSLTSQVALLHSLQEEAAALKQRADDITLMKEARDRLRKLY